MDHVFVLPHSSIITIITHIRIYLNNTYFFDIIQVFPVTRTVCSPTDIRVAITTCAFNIPVVGTVSECVVREAKLTSLRLRLVKRGLVVCSGTKSIFSHNDKTLWLQTLWLRTLWL